MRITALIAGAAVTLAAGHASARLVDLTYSGTVGQLSDPSHLFGAVGAASEFTLTFLADPSLGRFSAGGGGTGDGSILEGGTSLIGTPIQQSFPHVGVSPISAVLTIGGHRLPFGGRYYASSNEFNSFTGPGLSQVHSGAAQEAKDNASTGGKTVVDAISASVSSSLGTIQTYPFFDTAFALAIDGLNVTGAGSFSYRRTDTATGEVVTTTGRLDPTLFTVSIPTSVPEPAGPICAVFGLGLLAAVRLMPPRRSLRSASPPHAAPTRRP